MFPEWGPSYSNHLFFKEWKKHSLFDKLIGPPPSLVKEFSQDWFQKVETKIGDIPIKHHLFVKYARDIENIKRIKATNQY